MDILHPSKPLDYSLIAYNVRCMRMAHNQTQAELAELAGVDKATLYRLESGAKIHRRNLDKVCTALGESATFMNRVLPYGSPQEKQRVFIHRNSDRAWFASVDRRKKIPADSPSRLQNEDERLRLGRSNLVAWFQAYVFTMPRGPGMSMLEIFDIVPCGPNNTYEDCVVFCMRGVVIMRVAGMEISLEPGEGIGYRADETVTAEPANRVGPKELPPLLIFITANRKGHLPIEFGKPTRKRIRHSPTTSSKL